MVMKEQRVRVKLIEEVQRVKQENKDLINKLE